MGTWAWPWGTNQTIQNHKAEVFSRNKLSASDLKVNLNIERYLSIYIYIYIAYHIYIYTIHINYMISYCTLRYPILAIHVFQCQTSKIFELGTTFSINPAVQLGSQVAKGTGQHNSPVLPKPIPQTWSGSNLLCQRKHVVSIIHALVFGRFLRVKDDHEMWQKTNESFAAYFFVSLGMNS